MKADRNGSARCRQAQTNQEHLSTPYFPRRSPQIPPNPPASGPRSM